jgi:class 3 adenylate cyclase
MSGKEPEKADETISIVQRGNLKTIENTLRKQWRLGQNIVLCWSATDNGILLLMVPHYFLGNYSAASDAGEYNPKEAFARQLISGRRRKTRDELFEIGNRLGVSANFIKLPSPLEDDDGMSRSIEEIVRRYGLSYVDSRAVLLFDIAEFSLYTPFEQASQLNSLSYSMNSAYNKLLTRGIEVNFARTTTGDGYYVWNRELNPGSHEDLMHFLLLVLADNAMARQASKGNTVPLVRTAFHIGSHYELYQAEGVNPTLFSYIVGDVTIELARMVDLAQPGQIYIGDFEAELPAPGEKETEEMVNLNTLAFLDRCNADMERLQGIRIAGQEVKRLECRASRSEEENGDERVRRFKLTDKHGLTRSAYNLEILIRTSSDNLSLGLGGDALSASTDDSPDGAVGAVSLQSLRGPKSVSEE